MAPVDFKMLVILLQNFRGRVLFSGSDIYLQDLHIVSNWVWTVSKPCKIQSVFNKLLQRIRIQRYNLNRSFHLKSSANKRQDYEIR